MSKKITLPVHERFLAFQGEGTHMGRSAFFIRTFGCPVRCPWCDSAGTWHKEYVPKAIERLDTEFLTAEVVAAGPEFVVFTGGEPTIHKQLPHYCKALEAEGYPSHIETCGGFEFDREAFHHITVSPKREQLPLADNILGADELKLIIDHPNAVSEWCSTLDQIVGDDSWRGGLPIWLHPEWSQRENPEVLNAITEEVKLQARDGFSFRAGWQLHKLYKCDSLDERTKPLAPLGGDPKRGY